MLSCLRWAPHQEAEGRARQTGLASGVGGPAAERAQVGPSVLRALVRASLSSVFLGGAVVVQMRWHSGRGSLPSTSLERAVGLGRGGGRGSRG